MSGAFTSVNLSKLPIPAIVDPLSFETIRDEMIADMVARDPVFTALVASDPAYKVIEVCAYRELLLRAKANEDAKAVMLAYAAGSDLDQIAARYNVTRLDDESDDDLRRRVQLAFEGLSTAGPTGAYIFHALSANADVSDVAAVSDEPGIVDVFVLARSGSGIPSPAVIADVEAALNAEDVRPLTDMVRVSAGAVVSYTVEAVLSVFDGPDAAVVRNASQAAAEAYVTEQRKFGLSATRSGLFAALHTAGVRNVNLIQPAADVEVTSRQVALCTGVSVSLD